MNPDLRGWQNAHLPTPPMPPRPVPRRWPRILAAVVFASGLIALGWWFRADLTRALHRSRDGVAEASTAAQADADAHLGARAVALENLFDVTADPHGGDASVILPGRRPADAAQPVTVLQPAGPAGAAPTTDQIEAAKRGVAICDNEITKASAVIVRNQAAIRAAHDPQVGAWVRLRALYAQARTDRDRYDVSIAMHNLEAQEQNAQREIGEEQHLVDKFRERRANLATVASGGQ